MPEKTISNSLANTFFSSDTQEKTKNCVLSNEINQLTMISIILNWLYFNKQMKQSLYVFFKVLLHNSKWQGICM